MHLPARSGPVTGAAQKGLDALTQRDYTSANRHFAAALQHDPRNPSLNFLNGVTYHLRVRGGERGHFELAETGYIAALENRRDLVPAAVQLAYLYYEERRYTQAQRAAAFALDLERDNVEAARLLAAASYHLGDFEMALWAIERARTLQPTDAQTSAIVPLVYAANGLSEESEEALHRSPVSTEKNAALVRRLGQWREQVKLASLGSSLAQAPPLLTPAVPTEAPGTPPPIPVAPPPPSPTALPSAAPAQEGPMTLAWFDCQQALNQQQPSFGGGSPYGGSSAYGSTGTGDETIALPALPAPCHGRPIPRMAVIDAVLLRNDDTTSTGFGVNLLDNLSIFVSRTLNQSRPVNMSSAARTGTITDVVNLGTTSGGGISYSLNIANASDQRADIIARPSLLALDRQAAQFFSGSTVSVALISTQGGGSLQDKPVGVSLSVTPTFITDDELLISVKAARSFFETTASTATFTQSVQTSRNMVSANVRMRFNETLILSGLSEREITSVSSGVPILRDVPLLQYFFQRQTARDFTKSVIILLTPRRVQNFSEITASLESTYRTPDPNADPELIRQMRDRALRDVGGVWPNLLLALRHMDRNLLFRGVRTGDIALEEWEEPGRLRRMLIDASNLLYR